MATLDQTIKLILSAEDKATGVLRNVGDGVESVGTKMGSFNDSISDMTQPFADIAGGVIKADVALTALAVGGLAYAFTKSKDFESATIELKKVMGDFPEQLEAAQANARELSQTYGESATSILGSTASFKQAGFSVADSMTLAKNALDLVVAGDIEAAEASDLLVSALKGFGAPASDATRLIDILNEVSNNYATDVEQLAIGMAELSPIASTMGFSLEETAGVLTPVIEVFRSGGEAAVALKTGLLKLVDDSLPVTSALESIGVSQRDANGQLRSGKDILLDVSTAFQTIDQNQKLFVASQLVGVEQSARMVTVFDNLSKTTEITATAMNSAGSAAKEVAARLESSEVAINRFREGFVGLAAAVGDEFRDAAKEAIDGGTDIEHALTQIVASGALDELFSALEGELSELGTFLSGVAEDLPEAFEQVDFGGLLSALSDVSGEIEGLFDGLDLSTPEGLAEAIQKVVDGLEGLTNFTAGMVEGAAPFVEMLKGMVTEFINLDAETQKTLGSTTGFAAAINKITGPIGAALDAVKALGVGLTAIATPKILASITGLVTKLGGGAGLSGVLATSATSATSAVTLASNLGPLAAVTTASGVAVYKAVEGYNSMREAQAEAAAAEERLAETTEKLEQKYIDISIATGVNVESHQDLVKALDDGTIKVSNFTGELVSAEQYSAEFEQSVRAAADASWDWGEASKDMVANLRAMGVVLDETGDKVAPVVSEFEQLAATIRTDLGMSGDSIKGTFSVVSFGATEAADSLKDATEEADEFRLKMAELTSDERIRSMELSVDLNIAQLEADSEVMKSLIDGVGTSIESTTSLIGSLTGDLLDATSFTDKWLIEDLIRDQNDRQKEALDLQKNLTEAQIDLIDARTRALKSGESLITINGDGLAPELEAFMWKILESIQVRAAEEESAFLLGI